MSSYDINCYNRKPPRKICAPPTCENHEKDDTLDSAASSEVLKTDHNYCFWSVQQHLQKTQSLATANCEELKHQKMPKILNVCTLGEEEFKNEETTTMAEIHQKSLHDDVPDLNMEVEETIASDNSTDSADESSEELGKEASAIDQCMNSLSRMVSILASDESDGTFQFDGANRNLSSAQCSSVQTIRDENVVYDPAIKVKTEETSTNSETFSKSDTQQFQSWSNTESTLTGSASPAFIKLDLESQNEVPGNEMCTEDNLQLRNHLAFQSYHPIYAKNEAPHPVYMVKSTNNGLEVPTGNVEKQNKLPGIARRANDSLCAAESGVTSATAAERVVMSKTAQKTVKKTISSKRKALMKKVQQNVNPLMSSVNCCLVCNAPCVITQNRKIPSLPFCKKCKKAYFYQLTHRYSPDNVYMNKCPSRGYCRIDYRQPKICPKCHHTKFLAVLKAAQKAFKEPIILTNSNIRCDTKASDNQEQEWTAVRENIQMQEAIFCQPLVLLERFDEIFRPGLPRVMKGVSCIKQEPIDEHIDEPIDEYIDVVGLDDQSNFLQPKNEGICGFVKSFKKEELPGSNHLYENSISNSVHSSKETFDGCSSDLQSCVNQNSPTSKYPDTLNISSFLQTSDEVTNGNSSHVLNMPHLRAQLNCYKNPIFGRNCEVTSAATIEKRLPTENCENNSLTSVTSKTPLLEKPGIHKEATTEKLLLAENCENNSLTSMTSKTSLLEKPGIYKGARHQHKLNRTGIHKRTRPQQQHKLNRTGIPKTESSRDNYWTTDLTTEPIDKAVNVTNQCRDSCSLAGVQDKLPAFIAQSNMSGNTSQEQEQIPNSTLQNDVSKNVTTNRCRTRTFRILSGRLCENTDVSNTRSIFSKRKNVNHICDRPSKTGKIVRCFCGQPEGSEPRKRTLYAGKLRKRERTITVASFNCGHACSECNSAEGINWLTDHGYTMKPPLSIASDNDQLVMETESVSDSALIIQKLYEIDQLLQGKSEFYLDPNDGSWKFKTLPKKSLVTSTVTPSLSQDPSADTTHPSFLVGSSGLIAILQSAQLPVISTASPAESSTFAYTSYNA